MSQVSNIYYYNTNLNAAVRFPTSSLNDDAWRNTLHILTSCLNNQMTYTMNRAISFKRSISQFVAERNF